MKTLEFINKAFDYVDYIGIQREGFLSEKEETSLCLYGLTLDDKKGNSTVDGDEYSCYAKINLEKKNDYIVFASNMMDDERPESHIELLDEFCGDYARTPVEER